MDDAGGRVSVEAGVRKVRGDVRHRPPRERQDRRVERVSVREV